MYLLVSTESWSSVRTGVWQRSRCIKQDAFVSNVGWSDIWSCWSMVT